MLEIEDFVLSASPAFRGQKSCKFGIASVRGGRQEARIELAQVLAPHAQICCLHKLPVYLYLPQHACIAVTRGDVASMGGLGGA